MSGVAGTPVIDSPHALRRRRLTVDRDAGEHGLQVVLRHGLANDRVDPFRRFFDRHALPGSRNLFARAYGRGRGGLSQCAGHYAAEQSQARPAEKSPHGTSC